ncbi:MAG: MFS transporter, partial [Pseudomonadota bacterium]
VISSALGFEGVLTIALIVALLLDLSINVSFNPTRSIIADLTPPGEQRTRGYTWMQTVSGTFGVLAYAIGAILGNIALIYVGAGIVFLFSIVPTLCLEEPRSLKQTGEAAAAKSASDLGIVISATLPLWAFFVYDLFALGRRLIGVEPQSLTAEIICLVATALLIGQILLRDRAEISQQDLAVHEFRKIMAAHAFSWIGVQTMFVFFFALAEFRFEGISNDALGQIVAISFLLLNAVAALLPAFVLGPMTATRRRVFVHAAALGVMSFGYFVGYFIGHSPAAVFGSMLILGVGWAAIVSLPFAIMSVRIDEARMGLYMGLFNLSVVLPQLFVSMGIALVVQRLEDKGVVFLIGALSLAISALLWTRVRRADPTPVETVELGTGGH